MTWIDYDGIDFSEEIITFEEDEMIDNPTMKYESYRQGCIDGIACRPFQHSAPELAWYERGWDEGRTFLRLLLTTIRKELDLPQEWISLSESEGKKLDSLESPKE